MQCNKCGNEVENNYCSHCGFPAKIARINKEFVFFGLAEVLNLNGGLFYTLKELTIRPGKAVKTYIKKDRSMLLKPITFLFLCSLLYTLVSQYFTFDSNIISFDMNNSAIVNSLLIWINSNYGYMNLFLAIVNAFWLKTVFKNRGYNYFECLVAFAYTSAYVMVIYSIFGIFASLINSNIMQLAGLIGIVYPIWALGQFFEGNRFTRTLKTTLAFILSLLSIGFTIIVFGVAFGLLFGE